MDNRGVDQGDWCGQRQSKTLIDSLSSLIVWGAVSGGPPIARR
jgi:hypothetical protein